MSDPTEQSKHPGHHWDARYRAHPWATEPDPELVERASSLTPGTALDLGCGTGRHALWLASRGWRVTGVDGSTVGLEIAAEHARERGLSAEWVTADLTTWVASHAYDLVVVANIHLLPEERSSFFARVAASVAPGGHLYVIGHHVDALGVAGPPDPRRLYTDETLARAFPHLTTLEHARLERPAEGEGPAGVDVLLWATRPTNPETSR